jgi:Bacteriophage tail sheath protein
MGPALRAAFVGRHGHWPEPEPLRVESAYEARSFSGGGLLGRSLRGWFANGGGPCYVAPLGAASDPLYALDKTLDMLARHSYDVVCFPGLAEHVRTTDGFDVEQFGAAQRMIVEACIAAGDRIAVLDPPPGLTAQEMRDWRVEVLGADTPHAVLYYPWLRVADRNGRGDDPDELAWVPPCGHVIGAWARVARQRGLLAAHGNLELTDVLDVATNVSTSQQEMLTRLNVNLLRALPSWGVRTWGSRTLSISPWLFQIPTARLLVALKPVVMERIAMFSGAGELEMVAQIDSAVRGISGLADDAFVVRALSAASSAMRIEIELNPRVTLGYPVTIVIELPAGRWTVLETEHSLDIPPAGHP